MIKRVSEYATWKPVENVENLPARIKEALTDEIVRGYRDPAPPSHDLFLKQKYQESIADTKRLWTALGVPDDVADELANDHSIGHKLTMPAGGTLTVNARQGSGKTLAAQRLYQQALLNRLDDHSQPLPIFLNARNISGDLNDQIEGRTRDHGSAYTQEVLVIIDGLDETGRSKANQLLSQAQSYTKANRNVAVVAMTRPLPELSTTREPFVLPECSEDEFLSIASKIAGREVRRVEVPFREHQSRLPLFATMVGAYLRQPVPRRGRTPSQIVNEMARRILDEAGDYSGDTEGLLKKLALESIASGESVEKSRVALRASEQALLVNSRIVVEEGGKFDFTLAIFREWFAARAIVERMVSIDDIVLNSDRWVVPLAIAINSENSTVSAEIMERLATTDPGMAGLVLKEVEHSWSTEEATQSELAGTAIEVGTSIRNAMVNWKDGLGDPLMSALGMLYPSGNVATLGVDVQQGWVTTSWHQGDETHAPVICLPRDSKGSPVPPSWDWPSRTGRHVEPTRVWPWAITRDELFQLLSMKLRSLQLALDSAEGFREFVYDLADNTVRWGYQRAVNSPPTLTDVVDCIDKWLWQLDSDPRGRITFALSGHSFTVPELESYRERIIQLSHTGMDITGDLWPGPDKEPPQGRRSWGWFERYSDERLVQRTNAIYNAALRIYNDIIERWFPTFNKRHQMGHVLPFRMRGEIHLLEGHGLGRRDGIALDYWLEWAHSAADSGVFIEMGQRNQPFGDATWEKVQAAQSEFAKRGLPYHSGGSILPGYESRPATRLAHEWLRDDLMVLNWTGL